MLPSRPFFQGQTAGNRGQLFFPSLPRKRNLATFVPGKTQKESMLGINLKQIKLPSVIWGQGTDVNAGFQGENETKVDGTKRSERRSLKDGVSGFWKFNEVYDSPREIFLFAWAEWSLLICSRSLLFLGEIFFFLNITFLSWLWASWLPVCAFPRLGQTPGHM